MLKKMLLGCLAIAGACALSTSAYAAGAEAHGFLYTSFGSYTGVDSSGDNYSTLRNTYLAPITLEAKGEKFTAGAEIDWITPGGNKTGDIGPAFMDWKAMDALTVTVGYFDPKPYDSYADGGGTIDPFSGARYSNSYTDVDSWGLHGTYQLNPDMKVTFGYTDRESIVETTGSGQNLAFEGNFGSIGVRAAYVTGSLEDPSDPNDEAVATNAMLVSANIGLGETMAVNFGYHTKKIDEADSSQIDFQFVGKKMGPGNIYVTYASETNTDVNTNNWINLVYQYPIEPGARIDFVYQSKTTTPEEGDSSSVGFMGAGFVKFF